MSNPKASIGLAVYNGERYLRQALDSILAQTFTDFELIISDNASTDSTGEISKEYAARDSRIRYHRNQANIGGANNENQTFHMARGEYFRLAAYDDYLAPTLLEKCVAVLDKDPAIVLVYTGVVDVDAEGLTIRIKTLCRATGKSPSRRFHELAFFNHGCEPTYGVVRSEVLGATRLQQNYKDSDRVLLCELALRGQFYEIPEPLFYKRYHPRNAYIDVRARISWYNPAWKGRIALPYWRELFDLIYTIHRVPLPAVERFRCYGTVLLWLAKYGKKMVKDLVVAGYMLLHSREWRVNHAITNWE